MQTSTKNNLIRIILFVVACALFASVLVLAGCAGAQRIPADRSTDQYYLVLAKADAQVEGLQPSGGIVRCDEYGRNPQITTDMLRMRVREELTLAHCPSGSAEISGMPEEHYDLRNGGHWICVRMEQSMLTCQ
ncbi:MAG TPA: hypothetical protein VEA18_00635 [Candidatus Kapabacteria bacterium]|nr:hypothetical protein [Candidatus Kapabacteria bacterium]